MGMLIDGRWQADDVSTTDSAGRWKRAPSTFRHWVRADDSSDFTPQSGRYHLYVAWNCPWAHRALLARTVMGLDTDVDVSIAAPQRNEQGWMFDVSRGYADRLFGCNALHEIYTRSDPAFTGRVTVPVLWDKHSRQIVSNESADIMRMFATEFESIARKDAALYPAPHRRAIDAWNDEIHSKLNNGVYRAGFATTQAAYDAAVFDVFATIDHIEAALAEHDFLVGSEPTEADWRLFPTLARFDVAYYSAFKCNVRRVSDYPRLWRYARALYHRPGIAATVKFDIYRRGYHSQSIKRNPHGIVPLAPELDWSL